ncbi:MAG: LytR family transcriptional regulator [Streptosporangiales bacterium]|nr:LytR family transcriptional regulator [Streptosporangiales bacterium]
MPRLGSTAARREESDRVYTPERLDRDGASSRASRRRRRRTPARQTWAAVGLAAVSTLLPGSGHIWAGRRRSGIAILAFFLLLAGGGVLLATVVDPTQLLVYAVDTNVLTAVMVTAVLLAIGWSAVIVSAYHLRRPGQSSVLHGLLAALVVGVLSFAVSTPPIYAARQAYVGRDVISNVFNDDDKQPRKSKEGKDPWADKPRLNVLLLGGDGGRNRTGVRTDTMIVASIDTRTGDTVMFSLPRNMLNAPMPDRMKDEFPSGYTDMLNAVYVYGTDNPNKFKKGSNPGAQATQEVISEILGLKIDYYALVNLKAFEEIIDAIGGITVYVEKDLPIGPEGAYVGYVRKGKRHLNGKKALWYARSRAADDDYHRMQRQRCVMAAIAKQADPATVMRSFQKIAATTKKNVKTDIPNDDLPALLQLGKKAKSAEISSLPLIPPLVDTGNPDYPQIKAEVQETIRKAEKRSEKKRAKKPSDDKGKAKKPKTSKTGKPGKPNSVEAACGLD